MRCKYETLTYRSTRGTYYNCTVCDNKASAFKINMRTYYFNLPLIGDLINSATSVGLHVTDPFQYVLSHTNASFDWILFFY